MLIWSGTNDPWNVMIMELLGKSVGDLWEETGSKFSIVTTARVAVETIDRLEALHDAGFIHRDMKPKNLVIGRGRHQHNVYLLDFGLTKPYLDKHGNHIPYQEDLPLVGTPKYASVNNHKGRECGRKDDLEALGYILLRLHAGTVPWDNMRQNKLAKTRREKYVPMGNEKDRRTKDADKLFKEFPKGFAEFMHHCRDLGFEERPDYAMCRGLFQKILDDAGYSESDKAFAEWSREDYSESATASPYDSSSDSYSGDSDSDRSSDSITPSGAYGSGS